MSHVIEATILTGCGMGDVFILRIPLTPSVIEFRFETLQFLIRLSFIISINKSHDPTLSVVGLHFKEDCSSWIIIYRLLQSRKSQSFY